MKRNSFIFSGRVQNVGFRYSARQIAEELGLTGWVRNMDDGKVAMEVQGSPENIEKLIENLENQVFVEIDDIIKENIPLNQSEKRFVIIG